jgi:hypothetical protein
MLLSSGTKICSCCLSCAGASGFEDLALPLSTIVALVRCYLKSDVMAGLRDAGIKVERTDRTHAEAGSTRSSSPQSIHLVANSHHRITLRQGRDRDRKIESEDDGFVETKLVFAVPKAPDLAVSGIHFQPIDKYSEQGQEGDLEEEDDYLEEFGKIVSLSKRDLQQGDFKCAQGRLLKLGLHPKHEVKIYTTLQFIARWAMKIL